MSANSVPIEVDVQRDGDTVVLLLAGEVDLTTAPAVSDVLGSVVDPDTRQVVLDLTGVGFLDSSGLALTVALYRDLGPRDGVVTVRNANTTVRKIFSLTGIDQIVDVEPAVPVAG